MMKLASLPTSSTTKKKGKKKMKLIANGHGKKHFLLFLILGKNLLMIDL
jgi:hypothetical protein